MGTSWTWCQALPGYVDASICRLLSSTCIISSSTYVVKKNSTRLQNTRCASREKWRSGLEPLPDHGASLSPGPCARACAQAWLVGSVSGAAPGWTWDALSRSAVKWEIEEQQLKNVRGKSNKRNNTRIFWAITLCWPLHTRTQTNANTPGVRRLTTVYSFYNITHYMWAYSKKYYTSRVSL